MSTTVTYEANQYLVPSYQDTGWAQGIGNLQSLIIAMAQNVLQRAGGSFTLTGTINFGPNFGIQVVGIIFTTPNGLHTYQIGVDNDGALTSTQLT